MKTPKKLFGFVAVSVLLTSCGIMDIDSSRRRENAPAQPQVRDVPYEARDNEDLRKKLIVLPFLDSELQRSENVKEVARRTVVEDLVDTRSFIVVNNADIPQDLGSMVKENKEYDMVAVSRIAAQLGVAGVVEGRVLEIHAKRMGDEIGVFRKLRAQIEVTVQIRVFAARTAKEIFNVTKKATVESETTRVAENSLGDRMIQDDPNLIRQGVRKAFRDTVGGIVKSIEKLAWEGRIAMVNGDKIYINAGRISGIQVGDIMKITEEGDEVFDPETGSFIGKAPGRMKGTVEIVTYFGKDGAIAIVHSGSGFKENDRVEMY